MLERRFALSRPDLPFIEWHRDLKAIAAANNGSADDADGWYEVWEQGKTPAEAWADEWGEQ